MTLVRQVDGAWVPIGGVQTLERMVATCTVTYHDGRQAEAPCDPYPVAEMLDLAKVQALVARGVWSAADLEPYGLRAVVVQDVPEGKRRIGDPSYVERDGEVIEEWVLEDVPPPPPDPTPAEKIAALGLTRDDLKALLADD